MLYYGRVFSDLSNTHAQPLGGAKSSVLCLKLPLVPYIITRTAKTLARLRGCAGSPDPSLFPFSDKYHFHMGRLINFGTEVILGFVTVALGPYLVPEGMITRYPMLM